MAESGSLPAFEVIGEARELIGCDAQRLRGVLAYFRDDAIVEVSDDFLHIVFHAVAASAEMFIDFASEVFEWTCGWFCHNFTSGLADAFSIAG